MAWIPMLPGNLATKLGPLVEGWDGPEKVQGFENKNGDVRKVRSEWSKPDGSRKRVELSLTARGTIIRQQSIRGDIRPTKPEA